MLDALKKRLFHNRLYAFNAFDRDGWVATQANRLPAGVKILDVGAGSCPYRHLFSHCQYQTQDVGLLENGQLRHGGYGKIDYLGDAARIPAVDGCFDAVLCTEMLEHHPEPIRVVHELARILRPGGVLILTAPLGSGIHQEPYHFYGGYTPYWYQRFLTDAGFGDIEVVANGGFYRHYAQESLRFLAMTRPLAHGMPRWLSLMSAPIWLTLVPVMGGVFPLMCMYLDRFDIERRFTVGYHVTATRK
jgi:SAM-dependent methyltransferase